MAEVGAFLGGLSNTYSLNPYNSSRVDAFTLKPSIDYLFDIYGGANLGLSLRRLSSSFSGDLLNIVRANDFHEKSFELIGGVVDILEIEDFLGGNPGRANFWADQSGNENHAFQDDFSLMPVISFDGSVIIDDGTPAMLFNGSWMNLTNTINEVDNTKIAVGRRFEEGGGSIDVHFFGTGTPTGSNTSALGIFNSLGFTYYLTTDKLILNASIPRDFEQFILWGSEGNSTLEFRKDGASIYVAPSTFSLINSINKIGVYVSNGVYDTQGAFFKEAIHYPTNQISNVTGIETNINTYYGIY
jgi:hypothetical protein